MTDRHAIWQLLDKLQMDNRAQAAKLLELRSHVAGLDLPDTRRYVCQSCGTSFRGPQLLAEHVYRNHAGPVPEHFLAADRLAGVEA